MNDGGGQYLYEFIRHCHSPPPNPNPNPNPPTPTQPNPFMCSSHFCPFKHGNLVLDKYLGFGQTKNFPKIEGFLILCAYLPITEQPSLSVGCKRPALPAKEYEEAADQLSLTFAYDYTTMSCKKLQKVAKSCKNL